MPLKLGLPPTRAGRTTRPVDGAICPGVCVADTNNNRIRMVDKGGVVTTIAGGGATLGDGGPATSAGLVAPSGVAVDGLGRLYLADRGQRRMRRVELDGKITTIAGNGTSGWTGDGGQALLAQLQTPSHVTLGPNGTYFITDFQCECVRKVDANGIITTVAGHQGVSGTAGDDGPGE